MGFCFSRLEERMKQMQVDRLEEGLAVLVDEEERSFCVPKDFFGFALHAGDVLMVETEDGKPVRARFLAEETEARKTLAKELMQKLKRRP